LSHFGCLARHAGPREVVEKAQALSLCKASVFFGAQVLRGRETRSDDQGERSSGSNERRSVERTSVFVGTHRPSRGDAGTGGLSGGSPHVRVERFARCEQNAREVPPPVAVLARRMRCAVRIRGGASPAQTTGEPSARVGPVPQHGLFGGTRCAARQPVPFPSASEGADEGEGGERVVTSSSQNEETVLFASVPVHRRIAEVGRTPSGSEKRATSDGRVESLAAKTERVNGSLTIGGRSGAQAQGRTGGKRGADHRELGDPHHVSAASSMKAAWFRPGFGAGEMRVGVCRWKAPWVGEAHAFHEAPAEPILAASEPACGARRKASPRDRNGGGDRGVRGDR